MLTLMVDKFYCKARQQGDDRTFMFRVEKDLTNMHHLLCYLKFKIAYISKRKSEN